MAIPTPAVPTFTDGQVVHATDLNALGSSITNLFNYNQGGFSTQRPCVIASQTTGQSIPSISDTLVTFNTAAVNTNNMWVASQANQITIQTAGIYWLFSQIRWPSLTQSVGNISGTVGDILKAVSSSILLNGTNAQTNSVATQLIPYVNTGAGPATQCGLIANLAAGSTVFLNAWQSALGSQTLPTNFGGSYLGAIFLTPSS